MQFLMLFKPDFSPFDSIAVERAFRLSNGFTELRLNEPDGAIIECEFIEPNDRTIIRLSGDSRTITIDHTWGAALSAALVVQKCLGVPLRMVNDDNTFDLTFSDISTLAELEAAIDNARTN